MVTEPVVLPDVQVIEAGINPKLSGDHSIKRGMFAIWILLVGQG